MRPAAWFWLAWALAGVLFEAVALWRGVYADTFTGNARTLMLASPWLLWLIPTLVIGLAVHLLIEAGR